MKWASRLAANFRFGRGRFGGLGRFAGRPGRCITPAGVMQRSGRAFCWPSGSLGGPLFGSAAAVGGFLAGSWVAFGRPGGAGGVPLKRVPF